MHRWAPVHIRWVRGGRVPIAAEISVGQQLAERVCESSHCFFISVCASTPLWERGSHRLAKQAGATAQFTQYGRGVAGLPSGRTDAAGIRRLNPLASRHSENLNQKLDEEMQKGVAPFRGRRPRNAEYLGNRGQRPRTRGDRVRNCVSVTRWSSKTPRDGASRSSLCPASRAQIT